MKVKALREHSNQHGLNFLKKKGDVYLHRNPEADIATGMVEPADEKAELTTRRRKKAAVKTVSGKKALSPRRPITAEK